MLIYKFQEKFYIEIKINGESNWKIENKDAKSYENVKITLGDKKDNRQPLMARIRNFGVITT